MNEMSFRGWWSNFLHSAIGKLPAQKLLLISSCSTGGGIPIDALFVDCHPRRNRVEGGAELVQQKGNGVGSRDEMLGQQLTVKFQPFRLVNIAACQLVLFLTVNLQLEMITGVLHLFQVL